MQHSNPSVPFRVWSRMICVFAPGTGRHRLYSKFNELETRYHEEHNRAESFEEQLRTTRAALEAERQANRTLQGQLSRAASLPGETARATATPKVNWPAVQRTVISGKDWNKANEDDRPTIPIEAVGRSKGITVRTLSGAPLLGYIPLQGSANNGLT
jgi:hypothetical protein